MGRPLGRPRKVITYEEPKLEKVQPGDQPVWTVIERLEAEIQRKQAILQYLKDLTKDWGEKGTDA